MTPFILYQLKAGFCIMLFTGLYYTLFHRETFHRFNRFYLLAGLLLSSIIPVIQFRAITVNPAMAFPNLINEVTVYAGGESDTTTPVSYVFSPFKWIYIAITALFFGYLLVQLIKLVIIVFRQGTTSMNGCRLVILPEKAQSFSFFNLIFLNADAAHKDDINLVLQHEMAHVRQWHSFDIMLIQIVKIFQWFNPFVFLMEKTIKETHEYLADEAVLEQDGEFDRYRLLMLTQVFGIQPGIFSFFNYSLIKKRLIMMKKEKSPARNRLKYLTTLPLVLFLGLFLCSTFVKSQEPARQVVSVTPDGDTIFMPPAIPEPPPPPTKQVVTANEELTFEFVEEQALFEGGSLEKFMEWAQKNVVYPPLAVQKGIFGRVMAQFAINSKGKVCDVKILRGVDPLLDQEVLRVLVSSPDWTPAKNEGKYVKQQFVMPIVFSLGEKDTAAITKNPDNEPVFVFVEKQAIFQGGTLENFREWVQQNLVYPPEAAKNKISGRVIVQFAIRSNGKVDDVKILRGVAPSLDQEAIRIIKLSPDWTPAEQGGRHVKQQFVMPVIFQLH